LKTKTASISPNSKHLPKQQASPQTAGVPLPGLPLHIPPKKLLHNFYSKGFFADKFIIPAVWFSAASSPCFRCCKTGGPDLDFSGLMF
jgi:hypothetical protein